MSGRLLFGLSPRKKFGAAPVFTYYSTCVHVYGMWVLEVINLLLTPSAYLVMINELLRYTWDEL